MYTQTAVTPINIADPEIPASLLLGNRVRREGNTTVIETLFTIEEFSSKIKQIHFVTDEKNRVFFDRIYTYVYGKTKFRFKKKLHLRELSGSKFHFVTSSNVIMYNDVKNSIFIKSGFIWFWN